MPVNLKIDASSLFLFLFLLLLPVSCFTYGFVFFALFCFFLFLSSKGNMIFANVEEIMIPADGFEYLHLGISFLNNSTISVFFIRTD